MAPTQQYKLLFGSIPKCDNLQYFIGVINLDEEREQYAPTDSQWQILKSRFLIWKNPLLLASPAPKQVSQINIVVSKKFVETGELVKVGEEHKLSLRGAYPLTDQMYTECIMYSLAFRLAPQWNKIAGVFVCDSDFLTSTEPMDSVRMFANVSDGKLVMSVTALRTRLLLLNIVDLGVDWERLQATGEASVNCPVRILPHLKQATARSITTTIPASCPFPSYQQLRRYWKNTYGYRLPHQEEGMLYVQVGFHWTSQLYTYPIICVRPGELVQLTCRAEREVLESFARHIELKLPSVCGQPLRLQTESGAAFRPTLDLNASSVIAKQPNLMVTSLLTQPSSLNQREPAGANDHDHVHCSQPQVPPVNAPASVELLKQNAARVPVFTKTAKKPTFMLSPFIRTAKKPIFTGSTPSQPAKKPTFTALILSQPAKKPTFTASTPSLSTKKPTFVTSTLSQPTKKPTFATSNLSQPAKRPTFINSASNSQPVKQPTFIHSAVKSAPPRQNKADIMVLAKSKCLTKATVSQLSEFCKENGIPVRSKDKKAFLVEKIYQFFNAAA